MTTFGVVLFFVNRSNKHFNLKKYIFLANVECVSLLYTLHIYYTVNSCTFFHFFMQWSYYAPLCVTASLSDRHLFT